MPGKKSKSLTQSTIVQDLAPLEDLFEQMPGRKSKSVKQSATVRDLGFFENSFKPTPGKNSKSSKQRVIVQDLEPLEDFFKQCSRTFTYEPTEPATSEFHRLCRVMRWKPDSRMRKEASKKFQDALIMEFNKHYGTDAKNLKSWQTLCAAVNVDPIPDNLAEARQAILGVHVNLVDLTCVANPSGVRLFPTEEALSEYTRKTHKVFPLGNVHSGGLLRALLRHIFREPTQIRRRRKRVRYRRSKYPLRGVPWDDGSEYDQSEDDEPEYGESEYGESEDDDSSGDDEWEYGEWKYGESEYDDFKLEDDKDWMKEDNDPYPMPAMHDFDWF